ncbi:unnamed protein product [Nyctereutes procyonoides]|uniref:(raccoon dog) hypothetical protein n=1 Tax=Nyctereutes procyonoides TaxID=34880 RepID=A0A811ZAX0_NYCPR|nr:unnamed protein product [Nyctereutes procyonoides]
MRREINTPEFGRLEGNMWTWGRDPRHPSLDPARPGPVHTNATSPQRGDRKVLEPASGPQSSGSQEQDAAQGRGGVLPLLGPGSSIPVQSEIQPEPQREDPKRGHGAHPCTPRSGHADLPPTPTPPEDNGPPTGPRSRKGLGPEKIFYPVQKNELSHGVQGSALALPALQAGPRPPSRGTRQEEGLVAGWSRPRASTCREGAPDARWLSWSQRRD